MKLEDVVKHKKLADNTVNLKEKKKYLILAVNGAFKLHNKNPHEVDTNIIYGHILIDLVAIFMPKQRLKAISCYHQLIKIDPIYFGNDSFILSKIDSIKKELEGQSDNIKRADELERKGELVKALTILDQLFDKNQLLDVHHKNYGWTIYKFIKTKDPIHDEALIQYYFTRYIHLNPPKPSLLHTVMLTLALKSVKANPNIQFLTFIKGWDFNFLSEEDYGNYDLKEKKTSSLLSRIFDYFFEQDFPFQLDQLLDESPDNEVKKRIYIDTLRRVYFWKIYKASQIDKLDSIWQYFDYYNKKLSKYPPSTWHSEILGLAERLMQGEENWRFFNFFKNWNPKSFRRADWAPKKTEKYLLKPLALKAIKKVTKLVLNRTDFNFPHLHELHQVAMELHPDNPWVARDLALLYLKEEKYEKAIPIFKNLVIHLFDKDYFWYDFSKCFPNELNLRLGMLSKALSFRNKEDFIGQIRLAMAETLLEKGLKKEAQRELRLYKNHREKMDWKLPERFVFLADQVGDTVVKGNNKSFYRMQVHFANKFVFSNFPSGVFTLVDLVKNKRGKQRAILISTNGKKIQVNPHLFKVLSQKNMEESFKLTYKYLKMEDYKRLVIFEVERL